MNGYVLSAVPAALSSLWSATLAPTGHASAGLGLLLLHGTALTTGPILSISGGPLTELLIGGPPLGNLGPLPHSGQSGPPLVFSATIPSSTALCGLTWAAQCAVTGGFIDLSSGVTGVVGF